MRRIFDDPPSGASNVMALFTPTLHDYYYAVASYFDPCYCCILDVNGVWSCEALSIISYNIIAT